MKKSIIFILLFYTMLLQSQPLLIEEGKTWSIVNYPTENSNIYSYYLMVGSDTLSNSINYHKLLISHDLLKTTWSLFKLIRQNQDKVYFKEINSENEMLLYDFGVNELDSFQTYIGTKLKIDSIRTVNGVRYFHLSGNLENTVWIEDVGCIAGLMESHGGIGLVGLRTVLACCDLNNSNLYHDKNYSSCFISTKVSIIENSDFFLKQNSPNPFDESTIIRYSLPEIKSMAMINIYDLEGKQLKSFNISQIGQGEISIEASSLIPGIYIYNLIADGIEVDTKRMILTE